MAWTATVKDVKRQDERVEVLVVLSDGTITTSVRYAIGTREASLAWLRQQVLATIAATDMVTKDLQPGTVINTTPDDPPPPPPDPTTDELARAAFVANYQRLQSARRVIAAGVLVGDESIVTDLASVVRSAFKPEYLDGL